MFECNRLLYNVLLYLRCYICSFEIFGTLVSFLFGVRSSALLFLLGCCISVVISAVLGRNSQIKPNGFSN